MENERPDPVMRALRELESGQTKLLNRLLACEAAMEAFLLVVDPRALPRLAEAYALTKDRLASELPPHLQRPDLWEGWTEQIEGLQRLHQERQSAPPTSGG